LIYECPAHPIAPTMADTMNYRIEGNKLFVWNQESSNVYSKTVLNTPMFNPICCYLSVQLNQQIEENIKVYNHPSAYISKVFPNKIILTANIRGNMMLGIYIDNFTGTGSYRIPYQKASLHINYGDCLCDYFSDSSDENSITIDEYDEVNNICTGRFNFTANGGDYSKSDFVYNLRNGVFALPIYQ